MFKNIKSSSLIRILIPEVILSIGLIFFYVNSIKNKWAILVFLMWFIYSAGVVVLLGLLDKFTKQIDSFNAKLAEEAKAAGTTLIKLDPSQLKDLKKGFGIKDPNSDNIITMSDISEV